MLLHNIVTSNVWTVYDTEVATATPTMLQILDVSVQTVDVTVETIESTTYLGSRV